MSKVTPSRSTSKPFPAHRTMGSADKRRADVLRSATDEPPSPRTLQHQSTTKSTTGSRRAGLFGQQSSHVDPLKRTGTTNGARPGHLTRAPSVPTRYVEMLLHMDQIPRLHNILASFFTWILLAGYIVIPGTFTSLKQAQDDVNHDVEKKIIHTVANLPLLWVAGVFCVIGALGMGGLWWRWRQNYVWLINRIFLPGFLNSIAGLISTIVNVYTARAGLWSLTAEITAIVIGACTAITMLLFGLYNFWALGRVKKSHDREVQLESQGDETLREKANRLAHEPALAPGSVV